MKINSDGRCSENPKPVELSEKEKKCREIFRKLIIIVQFVVLFSVVFVIGKDIYSKFFPSKKYVFRLTEGSKYDRVIQMKGVSFYLIGNETLMINGTELTTPSGGTEYEVILPSYNVTWSNDIYHQELYFKIYLGEEEMLRKSSDDRIDCQGQGTWCLRITTPHKM